jgi:two-component system sensor histidine kinase QseC
MQAQGALGEADDARRNHALLATLDGCDRATRLVEQLLTLSRLEAAALPAMAAVDLSALARQVVADLAAKAIGKKQTLEFEAAGHCRIPGNEILLGVLVRNLVDNAVRYSPPSARIKVAVEQQQGQVVLTVQDSGPGLTDAERQRLGERFFRALGSLESGSGLGWSIVRRIAAVHQMEVRVAPSTELGGLAVRVTAQADSAAA